MIKITKYPPSVELEEKQIKDLLNRYMYHVTSDRDNDIKLSFMKNGSFLVHSTEVATKIDMVFSSFTMALQSQEDENPMVKEIARLCVAIKKPIKIILKGKDNGII